MRTPIAQTLAYPDHIVPAWPVWMSSSLPLNLPSKPDLGASRASLAYRALEAGGLHPPCSMRPTGWPWMPSLDGRLGFNRIADVVQRVLDPNRLRTIASLDDVRRADLARAVALECIR